jgi:hypothetical protein
VAVALVQSVFHSRPQRSARRLVKEVSQMMRRLSVLAFLVVSLVTLASTPPESSTGYAGEGCRYINACQIECCDSHGFCVVWTETGCVP